MDLESTLSTIETYIAEEVITQVVDKAVSYIPQELTQVIRHASGYLPAEIDIMTVAQFLLYFAGASLVLGLLGRIILGKRSSLNHSLSSAVGILFLYALTIVIYTCKPWNLHELLSPLPFVTFAQEYLIVLPITDLQFPALCSQILSLVILAFLFNLVDTLIPKGEGILSWFILRAIALLSSLALHLLVSWAFHNYLPEILVQYAPAVLLFLLVFMLLSGIINLVLGLIIAVTNPFLGAMYTFFFSSIIGKQLSKAFFTSAIVCVVVYLLDFFGYTVISITLASLLAYIPLALILLVLWFLIGHVL